MEKDPMKISKEIGHFVRERREEIGVSRIELAKALHYKLPNMITMVETGATTFPLKRLPEYAKALDLPLHELAEEVFLKTFPYLKGHVRFHDEKHVVTVRKIERQPLSPIKKTASDE